MRRSRTRPGRRPAIGGVLTRSRGNFEEILASSDLLVEVMGGIEPARGYLLAAMRIGKDVVTANKQLLSQHGEELFETAREYGVRRPDQLQRDRQLWHSRHRRLPGPGSPGASRRARRSSSGRC